LLDKTSGIDAMDLSTVVADSLARVKDVMRNECQAILAAAAQRDSELNQQLAEVAREKECLEARVTELEQGFQTRRAALELDFAKKVAALEAELQGVGEEKAQMAQEANSDEVIRLNIGGERNVDVKRSTLCQCEGSLLSTMFSGRWDTALNRDLAGRVLIDFNPVLVMPMIDHLRASRAAMDGVPVPPPCLPAGSQVEFRRMLDYFGLTNFVYSSISRSLWSWDPARSINGAAGFSPDSFEVERCISAPIVGAIDITNGVHMWAVQCSAGVNVVVGVGTQQTLMAKSGQPYAGTAVVYNALQGCIHPGCKPVAKACTNDVIGVKFDVALSTLWFFRNGERMSTEDTGCLGAGPYLPVLGVWGGSRARLVSTTDVVQDPVKL